MLDLVTVGEQVQSDRTAGTALGSIVIQADPRFVTEIVLQGQGVATAANARIWFARTDSQKPDSAAQLRTFGHRLCNGAFIRRTFDCRAGGKVKLWYTREASDDVNLQITVAYLDRPRLPERAAADCGTSCAAGERAP